MFANEKFVKLLYQSLKLGQPASTRNNLVDISLLSSNNWLYGVNLKTETPGKASVATEVILCGKKEDPIYVLESLINEQKRIRSLLNKRENEIKGLSAGISKYQSILSDIQMDILGNWFDCLGSLPIRIDFSPTGKRTFRFWNEMYFEKENEFHIYGFSHPSSVRYLSPLLELQKVKFEQVYELF